MLRSDTIRAVAVRRDPSEKIGGRYRPHTAHLRHDVVRPTTNALPADRWVRFRPCLVGVDGTDREIIEGKYGNPPPRDPFLIIGHECVGEVLAVGPRVPDIQPGHFVVPTVRRPGASVYDRLGYQDLTTDDTYLERGINFLHGFFCEEAVESAEHLVGVSAELVTDETAVLLEPISVVEKAVRVARAIQEARLPPVWEPKRVAVLGAGTLGLLATLAFRIRRLEVTTVDLFPPESLKAQLVRELGARYLQTSSDIGRTLADEAFDLVFENTGNSSVTFQALRHVAKNGICVWVSITGGDGETVVPTDVLNQAIVLGNKAVVGVVNAHLDDFVAGIEDFSDARRMFPGWLPKLLTHPIEGLENFEPLVQTLLKPTPETIKVYARLRSS